MLPCYLWLLVVLWVLSVPAAPVNGIPFVHAAQPKPHPQNAPTTPSDFIKSLQRELKRGGYDPGVADGRMGPATQRALRRFQEAHNLPLTGDPDIPTLTKLLERGLPP
jgi:peptidoglycan hydrolase-like protein with peptidoglycan-binding domain